MKPTQTPKNPCFSSGPCAKHPGWSLDALKKAAVGRSHRAKSAKTKLAEVIDRSKKLLGMPADYLLGIVPASDTGAVEMAMWSMLGPARRRCTGVGKFQRRLGRRLQESAEAGRSARSQSGLRRIA